MNEINENTRYRRNKKPKQNQWMRKYGQSTDKHIENIWVGREIPKDWRGAH